jgi:sRNA-binding protein
MTEHKRIAGTLRLPGFQTKTPAEPPPPPVTEEPPPPGIPGKTRDVGLIKILADKWPAAFDQGPTKPLAIGIDTEIREGLAAEVSNKQLSDTLRWWTCRDSYLIALTQPQARRYGLDGSDAGPVTDHDREIAAQRLEERRARRKT